MSFLTMVALRDSPRAAEKMPGCCSESKAGLPEALRQQFRHAPAARKMKQRRHLPLPH
jgi:hypothetical protein